VIRSLAALLLAAMLAACGAEILPTRDPAGGGGPSPVASPISSATAPSPTPSATGPSPSAPVSAPPAAPPSASPLTLPPIPAGAVPIL
jgi:hypothetical protein